jgi:hypothetical protein
MQLIRHDVEGVVFNAGSTSKCPITFFASVVLARPEQLDQMAQERFEYHGEIINAGDYNTRDGSGASAAYSLRVLVNRLNDLGTGGWKALSIQERSSSDGDIRYVYYACVFIRSVPGSVTGEAG